MEKPSITYSATQSIDYLGQTHKWTDTDIIPSYKEICKQLDVCQKKLREEREQKGQRELRKSTSYSKQLEQQGEESTLRVEEKRLIRMKNALWRRMGSSVCYVGKGSKLESPKTLKSSSLYQKNDKYSEKQKNRLSVPRCNRFLQSRRIQRRIRHESAITLYTLNYFNRLPRQNTNDPFSNQIFNGINFH